MKQSPSPLANEAVPATLKESRRNSLTVPTLAITLPSVGDTNHINQVIFNFTTGSNPLVSFEASPISGIRPSIYANEGFSIDANTTYEINAIYNGNTWVLAAIRIDATDISS